MLPSDEHYNMLMQGESLASSHKEYRRVVREVAQAETQAEEIDTLLKWKSLLTTDHRDGERISHDIRSTKDRIYYYEPKQTGKAYAGFLDDAGAPTTWKSTAYGQTLYDLYMEVLQLVAYAFYHIAPMPRRDLMITPCSACDLAESYRLADEHEDEDEDE